MTAISKAMHYKLTNDINKSSSTIIVSENLMQELKQEAVLLQELYEKYSFKLSEVQTLIKEYEAMQRKIKVKLRKQQIKNLKQQLIGDN